MCPKVRKQAAEYQEATWQLQRSLGLIQTRRSDARVGGCDYARWVRDLWKKRVQALYPLRARRDAVVARLNRYLARSPMHGLGATLERVGRREGVSPFFIVGVAGKESTLGSASCGSNPRNVWGLGACGRAWSPPYFRTWEHAVTYFARFVMGRTSVYRGWPSARTPYDFGGYCSGCESSWASAVLTHMARMQAGVSVRYP